MDEEEALLEQMEIIWDARQACGWGFARSIAIMLGWGGDIASVVVRKGDAQVWSSGPSWARYGIYDTVDDVRRALLARKAARRNANHR